MNKITLSPEFIKKFQGQSLISSVIKRALLTEAMAVWEMQDGSGLLYKGYIADGFTRVRFSPRLREFVEMKPSKFLVKHILGSDFTFTTCEDGGILMDLDVPVHEYDFTESHPYSDERQSSVCVCAFHFPAILKSSGAFGISIDISSKKETDKPCATCKLLY